MGELLGLKVMASLEMDIWLGQKGSSVLYCIGDSVEGRWGVVLDFCFLSDHPVSFLLGKSFLFLVRRSRSRTRSEDRVPSPTYSTEDGLTSSHFQLRDGRLSIVDEQYPANQSGWLTVNKIVMVIKCHMILQL